MKILGIILIFLGATTFGYYYSYKPIFRKNDLLEMKRAILILNSEIKFLSSGIKECIVSIEKVIKKPIKDIFSKFGELLEEKRGEELNLIWEKALEEEVYNTYLNFEDIEKFKMIYRIIGGYDKELNIKGLEIVLDYIDTAILEIDREKGKNSKMYQSLGVLGGLALIILLI